MLDELKSLFPKNKALYCTKNVIEEIDSLLENLEEIECLDHTKHNRALEIMAAIILAERAE